MDKSFKVIQVMPEFGIAGAEIMVENLSVSLKNQGIEVKIVSLFDEKTDITKRIESNKIPIFYLGKKKGLDVKIIYRLYKLLLKEKPDVIHTHRYVMPYAIPAAFLAGVRIKVHTIHNIADKEVGLVYRKINKIFYKYFKVIPIAISPIIQKSVIKEYNISENQVPMVYNGIDLTKSLPKNDYNFKKDNIKLLHIGRFSPQKNHAGLINAFKIIHDIEPRTVLNLIGAGNEENSIRDEVKKLGLEDSVNFLGIQSNVYPYLNISDIFLLPSRWEGMPITLIEAMATSLPIVASNVGGIPDMIQHNKTGLVVDGNTESIVSAVTKLISNRELRSELGLNAKIASSNFSVSKMTDQYMAIYKKNL